MPNQRIFYACQAVGVIERNSLTDDDVATDAVFLNGVQSVGVSLEQPFNVISDNGRFQKKNQLSNFMSGDRTYTITLERVLDKSSDPFYKTANYGSTYTINHIFHPDNLGMQGQKDKNNKCLKNYDIVLIYTSDDKTNVSKDSQTPIGTAHYRNCLITNISYSLSVGGYLTESITLTSKRVEHSTSKIDLSSVTFPEGATIAKSYNLDINNDTVYTKLPTNLTTVFTTPDDDKPILQSIELSVDINYTTLPDVGAFGRDNNPNVWAFVDVPLSISASFTGVSRNIYPTRDDILYKDNLYTIDEDIRIVLDCFDADTSTPNFFIFDLGQKNFVSDVSVSGGDSAGGNAELTISYANEHSDFVIAREASVQTITNPTSTY